jgi:hypothetical protein
MRLADLHQQGGTEGGAEVSKGRRKARDGGRDTQQGGRKGVKEGRWDTRVQGQGGCSESRARRSPSYRSLEYSPSEQA